MCIITGIISGIVAAATAISTAASAVGGALMTGLGAIGGAMSAAGSAAVGAMANIGFGMIGAVGGSSAIAASPTWLGVGLGAATIAGGVAAVGSGVYSSISMYQSARASAAAQQAQMKALEEAFNDSGKLEVNNTARTIQENSRFKRTFSSLRVPMGITPKQNTETITQNVYGVDTNTVAAATQNMTGLNIAA